jgi:hypothetical protein
MSHQIVTLRLIKNYDKLFVFLREKIHLGENLNDFVSNETISSKKQGEKIKNKKIKIKNF